MLLVAASAAAYGCIGILAKYAYRSHVGLPTLLFLRFGIAALCLLGVMAVRRTPFPRGRHLLHLVLYGGLGYVGHSSLFFLAVKNASASSVAIILYIYPALVTVFAAVVFKERVPGRKQLAIAMALLGAMLTVGKASGATPLGSVFALGSATVYAAYILVGSRLTGKASALASTTVLVGSAAGVYGVATLISGYQPPDSNLGWAAILALAVLCTVLAILSFFAGLHRVGPVTTSAISTLEPLVTVILAAALLSERIVPLQAVGAALVVAAVALLTREASVVDTSPLPGP
jgi:drug/metabolite transporter (DMT)-like permease